MIEAVILDYLAEELNVPVYMEEPEDPPERFILLQKTGSSRENHINRAVFTIQSYAESLYEAALLNEDVKTAMDCAVLRDDVSASRRNSDYVFPDTDKKRPRYQAVFEIVHY